MLRTASILILFSVAVASHADEPFDVSLASSADLGPHYRAVIRRATERYRGDLPSQATVGRSQATSAAGFEIGEVTDYWRGTTYVYLRSTSATGDGAIIAEAQFDDDPFPAELISLYKSAADKRI